MVNLRFLTLLILEHIKNKGIKNLFSRLRLYKITFLIALKLISWKILNWPFWGFGPAPLVTYTTDILWECCQIGDETPKCIRSSPWWQLTQHFGLPGRQDHHYTRVADFQGKVAYIQKVGHCYQKCLKQNLKGIL